MKEIEKQVEDIKPDDVDELTLDSHHFGKFTPELKAKIGFLSTLSYILIKIRILYKFMFSCT